MNEAEKETRVGAAAVLYERLQSGKPVRLIDSVQPFTRRPEDGPDEAPSLELPKLLILQAGGFRIEAMGLRSTLFGKEGPEPEPAVGDTLQSGKPCQIGPLSNGIVSLSSALADGLPIRTVQLCTGRSPGNPQLPPVLVIEVPYIPGSDDRWHRVDLLILSACPGGDAPIPDGPTSGETGTD